MAACAWIMTGRGLPAWKRSGKRQGEKSRKQTLYDRLDYDQREEKTGSGAFVSSYMCSRETAAGEFEAGRLICEATIGRRLPAEKDIIAYRILQSFRLGEITPEEVNKIGYELVMKFKKGSGIGKKLLPEGAAALRNAYGRTLTVYCWEKV